MSNNHLADYFEGVSAKRLSAVEADRARSRQHEYQTTKGMRRFLGIPEEKQELTTTFAYLCDEAEPIQEQAKLTYYNARENQPDRSPEYRLYFPETSVSERAQTGDVLFICKIKSSGNLLALIAQANSSWELQLLWLLGIQDDDLLKFHSLKEASLSDKTVDVAASVVLEILGVEPSISGSLYLDQMLEKFGPSFPSTRDFSEFARSTLEMDAANQPDLALIRWMEREEILFRTLEKEIISVWLRTEFSGDADEFMSKSLSLQNRRKSRAGHALENNLEQIFKTNKIKFQRTALTENKSKPDFLFPGSKQYQDPDFPSAELIMLGAKTTCKDRWRQVLTEAARISKKHLLTLESPISTNQTDEMKFNSLQLIVPEQLQSHYSKEQQKWVLSLADFISHVRDTQRT